MGCSIGGRVVLNLAATHADRFRALIGLQASAHVAPYYDTEWLHHADVHGGEVCAGIVSGLVGPDAPIAHRWETLWHYMQGGPGVFKGDLHFYKVDGDLRQRIASIDTKRCPLFLLTGEYDYSCSPAETEEVAAMVPGARCTIMPGLGHFPMSEDPDRFLQHLRPVLAEVAGSKLCSKFWLAAALNSHLVEKHQESPNFFPNMRATCIPLFRLSGTGNMQELLGFRRTLESRYAILQVTGREGLC